MRSCVASFFRSLSSCCSSRRSTYRFAAFDKSVSIPGISICFIRAVFIAVSPFLKYDLIFTDCDVFYFWVHKTKKGALGLKLHEVSKILPFVLLDLLSSISSYHLEINPHAPDRIPHPVFKVIDNLPLVRANLSGFPHGVELIAVNTFFNRIMGARRSVLFTPSEAIPSGLATIAGTAGENVTHYLLPFNKSPMTGKHRITAPFSLSVDGAFCIRSSR